MKLYCIEHKNCGYYNHILDEHPPELNGESIYDHLICPACHSILLVYDDHATPSFIERQVHVAPDGALWVSENDNNKSNIPSATIESS